MPDRDIIVIGASVGGMNALKRLCSLLPATLPASVFIVWHIASNASGNVLLSVLNGAGPLRVAFAEDGEAIQRGKIYVAPPDHHLSLSVDGIKVAKGPRENRLRPSIDTLFRSAAMSFGERVVGIVLTGFLDDGTQGLWFIKRRGGVTIAQDPTEAEAPSMPASAIKEGVAQHVLTLASIPPFLAGIVAEPAARRAHLSGAPAISHSAMSRSNDDNIAHLHPPDLSGPPIPLSCPDCNGSLWTAGRGDEEEPIRYQCHVGHQFSESGLAAAKLEEVELAMWTALRVLKESAAMYGTMAERARTGGRVASAENLEQRRRDFSDKADIIRRVAGTD